MTMMVDLVPLLLLCTAVQGYIVPPATEIRAAAYADWAHDHWVWLDHGGSGQDDCLQLVKDYKSHNISVGAIDIDSTWETGFNNFIFDTARYPNASAMVEEFHAMDVRVIFWITSFVDTDSSNYAEGLSNGYYLRNILNETGVIKWWHGKGSLVDYTNPEALSWWHKQMDQVLDIGIDGWKCDGTDPYILELVEAQGYSGPVEWHEYSDMYYGDFFNYTRQKLGSDRMIMSRPVDAEGPLFVKFSPKYVMTSGWVGDEDDTFEGLTGTLKRYLQSAWQGYANYGSDIGGYRNPDKPRKAELLLRWAQLGAFSPLMENGGGGEHRPWLVDTNETTFVTDIYRNFVDIHYQLKGYFLSIGSAALENGTSVMHPLAPHESLIDKVIDEFNPSTYAYLLGPNVLVHPINEAGSDNHTSVTVGFPNASDWVYWFDTSKVYRGGSSVVLDVPISEFPVFHRAGSIVPLNHPRNTSELHVHVFYPQPGQSAQFELRTNDYAVAHGLGLHLAFEHLGTELELIASAHHDFSVEWHLHGVVVKDTFPLAWQRDGTASTIETDIRQGCKLRVQVEELS